MVTRIGIRASVLAVTLAVSSSAQWTGSGSTGTDGPLFLTQPGTFLFNPTSLDPPLSSSHDNIYHFTSVYIAKGVTVKLSSTTLSGPIFWLSQGPVQIDGTLDLDGAAASGVFPSLPGAGGYPGGAAGREGYRASSFVSNPFLVPLVGGFGGDGGAARAGGGGGGALLIASSTSITVSGRVTANGGDAPEATGGGGGAIRLVAPVIEGTGVLIAKGGAPRGFDGRIRLESAENRFTGSVSGTPVFYGKPFRLFLPTELQPSIRVAINNIPLTGNKLTLGENSSVELSVESHYIAPGSTVELQFFAEDGASHTVTTSPLAGTFERSTAMASIALPKGISQAIVKTEWTPQAEPGVPAR